MTWLLRATSVCVCVCVGRFHPAQLFPAGEQPVPSVCLSQEGLHANRAPFSKKHTDCFHAGETTAAPRSIGLTERHRRHPPPMGLIRRRSGPEHESERLRLCCVQERLS